SVSFRPAAGFRSRWPRSNRACTERDYSCRSAWPATWVHASMPHNCRRHQLQMGCDGRRTPEEGGATMELTIKGRKHQVDVPGEGTRSLLSACWRDATSAS